MLFESDHNLSDLDNDDYGKLNSSSNNLMLRFVLSENADKNYILGQSCFGIGAEAHIIRLRYTKLATYKFVKSICVLNMLTFIFL